MDTKILHELSSQSLRSLAASLREGSLASGLTRHPLQQVSGPRAEGLEKCLLSLIDSGMTTAQLAVLVDVVAESKAFASQPADLVDLVLSGPDVPGIPTSETAAVMRRLIDDATSEVLLVG